MEFFKTTPNFDFLRIKWICIGLSWAIILAGGISVGMKKGFRYGIDFSGGTQLILEFREPVDANVLRDTLAGLGHGETVIQRFEDETVNQFLIRIQQSTEGADVTSIIVDGLAEKLVPGSTSSGKLDLNRKGKKDLSEALRAANADPDGAAKATSAEAHYDALAEQVFAERTKRRVFASPEDSASIAGLPAGVAAWLRGNTSAGPFVVLSQENVGPQVGKDLQRQATWAVVLSLGAMLIYIAFRFDYKFGIGAIVATIHDILITLSFFSFFDKEITLVVIAALLTLVGYSVNDTVVVYDRIRENLKTGRAKKVEDVINNSINQTLSRTILVSGTTMLAVIALFIFGGDVIHDFAFTLVVGIIIGTYSSIYVAAPVVVIWNNFLDKRKASAKS